jgi:hypothetical protein
MELESLWLVTVRNNTIEENNLAGFLMAGLCSVNAVAFGQDCEGPNAPRDGDPSANDNEQKQWVEA